MLYPNIDEMIALIRQSVDVDSAREALLGRAWQSDLVSEMLNRSDLDLTMARPEWLPEKPWFAIGRLIGCLMSRRVRFYG